MKYITLFGTSQNNNERNKIWPRHGVVYKYHLHKQAKRCFHKTFFPNECKMLLSALHHLNLITHVQCRPGVSFYHAMHFSANARSWDRMSSVCLSVCPSVTLVDCDHISWKSWKLIARIISPTPSLFVAKRRSTYSQGNMGKFWGN